MRDSTILQIMGSKAMGSYQFVNIIIEARLLNKMKINCCLLLYPLIYFSLLYNQYRSQTIFLFCNLFNSRFPQTRINMFINLHIGEQSQSTSFGIQQTG